ncbi:MAG TPA: PspC domain-containing protein [Patescibacteria group bacterium]|nr:PspC domain-containing protein [Patescibacteria group bacterium]
MNEVTKIHLGRSAFTIAADAHRELQHYLHDITKQVGGDKDVLEEIEVRMAELLIERHITGDKVVLVADVDYLKEQLGEPSEFHDDDIEPAESDAPQGGPKRLFRDPENALVAGVAAGLGAYTGLPIWLFRILFVLFTFSGGLGLLIYLVLWLVTPEATTSTERLQMQGKPVTVDTLKEVVNRPEVSDAARRAGASAARASASVGRAGERLAKLILALIGIGFLLAGIGACTITATVAAYALIHGIVLGGQQIFPIGHEAMWGVICVLVIGVVVGLLLMAVGLSMIKRRWVLPSWVTAALIALFMVGAALGAALGSDIHPDVANRVAAVGHSTFVKEPAFTAVQLTNLRGISDDLVVDNQYGIEYRTLGNVDLKGIAATVKDGVLTIDGTKFDDSANRCGLVCPYGRGNVQIVIHAPTNFSAENLFDNEANDGFMMKPMPRPFQ